MSNYNKEVVDYVVFSNKAPNYVFDKELNSLKIEGIRDLQEEINDGLDCSLERVIEKYGFFSPNLNVSDKIVDGIGEAKFYDDSKDEFRDSLAYLDEIRDKYNLPIDISDKELNSFISEKIGYLKGAIESKIKGGVVHETQTNESKEE